MSDSSSGAQATPRFASAIDTSSITSSGSLEIADRSATTKILVRSDQPQFGLSFGSSTSIGSGAPTGDALVCASRPGEWLILGSPEAVEQAEAAVDTSGFTSVIPFTHGRSLFRITGAAAPSMLEKVCGIDWSDHMTPNGAVVSASVALTTCDIIRDDANQDRSYLLMCDRSFGQYLFEALIDAGQEFGITVST